MTLLLLMALAAHFLTYVVVDSDFPFAEGFRVYVHEHTEENSAWRELIKCIWCTSGWTSAAVTTGVWAGSGLSVPLVWWLAVASTAGGLSLLRRWVNDLATLTLGRVIKEHREQNGGP